MNFEDKLIQSLQEKRKEITPPEELKHKVVSQMEQVEYRESKFKKQIVASCIAIFLLLPTSVFAYQAYLADELYGSFDNVKKHFVSATIDSYMLLHGKLLQAKGELGAQEYNQFKEQLQVITSFKMEYGDQYGNIDYTELTEGKRLEIKEALMTVQPFFDQLNGFESSQTVLSAAEYDAYIEALMTYQSILVQSGINPSNPFEIEDINPDQVYTFLVARNLIEDVDKKVAQQELDLTIPTLYVNQGKVVFDYGTFSSDAEVDFTDTALYSPFFELLSPTMMDPNSILEITFDKEPDMLAFQIIDKEGSTYTQGEKAVLQLPTVQGEYIIVVTAQWDNDIIPYILLVKM